LIVSILGSDLLLCNGTWTSSDTAVEVTGIADATLVSAGWFHMCALRSTGHLDCWGFGGDGALGNGTQNTFAFAVEVTGL
jgi:Regulator of chromosome condensation (RCC1) repeat